MMARMLGIFVVLYTMAAWLDRLPDRFLNLPNKGYWSQPIAAMRLW